MTLRTIAIAIGGEHTFGMVGLAQWQRFFATNSIDADWGIDTIKRQATRLPDALADAVYDCAMKAYAAREETRHEHLADLRRIYGYRSFSGRGARDLREWIAREAEAATSNEDLARRFVAECRRTRTILPGSSTIERLCADAVRAQPVQDRLRKACSGGKFGIGVQRVAVTAEPVQKRLLRQRRNVNDEVGRAVRGGVGG